MIINGATKDIGKAAILAVTRARGMEVAGAVDSHFIGQDAGKVLTFPFCFIFCLLSLVLVDEFWLCVCLRYVDWMSLWRFLLSMI